jgi:hypothetical protein
MNIQKVIRLAGMLAIMAVAFVAVGAFNKGKTPNSDVVLKLEAPSFVKTAYAEADDASTFDLGALLDQEAGISAYYEAPQTINLAQVRPLFKTIEQETSTYIVGSIAVPNYNVDHYDVHVYVNTNGWILAYYMRGEPVSKIVDLYNYSIENTALRTVVSVVAGTAGVPFSDVTYYHFGFPNATNMLFVYENWEGGNDFSIKMPGTYGYFERAWALRSDYCPQSNARYFRVNGTYTTMTRCETAFSTGWSRASYGPISASEMLPETTHVITVSHWGVLVVLYRVP